MQGITLILLAAGASARFGEQDKLLAEFQGRPLGAHAADLMRSEARVHRVAILPPEQPERRLMFEQTDWDIYENHDARLGHASSLCLGIRAAQKQRARAIIVCLADMPFIKDHHIHGLIDRLCDHDGVMSQAGDTLTPPAIFSSATFDALLTLQGDRGAKSIFLQMENRTTYPISAQAAQDIDTPETLMALNQAF